jgi:hypothetical protein
MAQMAHYLVLKMEIGDSCFCAQHLVGVGEVKICLIEMGPSGGLVATRIEHYGECHECRDFEAINDSVGTSCFIIYVEVELLQICGPLLMVVILQFTLCLDELQRLMISIDDSLLPENIIPPLMAGLHNGLHLFFIIRVLTNDI